MNLIRMVPRQIGPLKNGAGFFFEGRIMKWDNFEIAKYAARLLGVDEETVVPMRVLPSDGGDDSDAQWPWGGSVWK
jgi:hypothetical protein